MVSGAGGGGKGWEGGGWRGGRGMGGAEVNMPPEYAVVADETWGLPGWEEELCLDPGPPTMRRDASVPPPPSPEDHSIYETSSSSSVPPSPDCILVVEGELDVGKADLPLPTVPSRSCQHQCLHIVPIPQGWDRPRHAENLPGMQAKVADPKSNDRFSDCRWVAEDRAGGAGHMGAFDNLCEGR